MSVISRKNQVTIPAGELRAAGLHPGDDVRVAAVGPGRLEVVKTEDLVAEFAGVLDARGPIHRGYLEDIRRGWR